LIVDHILPRKYMKNHPVSIDRYGPSAFQDPLDIALGDLSPADGAHTV
jgi:hypothetical protein